MINDDTAVIEQINEYPIHKKPSKILQLKIELTGSKPLIWRRITVPNNYTFFDLHVAIRDAMGWLGYHLHQFMDSSPYKNKNYIIIKIHHPDDNRTTHDEIKTNITDFLKNEKDSVWYEYDFGDSWMHKITLEKILPCIDNSLSPNILAGKNACPWEDSGSLFGFYEKIDILKNKKHPLYEEIHEWALYLQNEVYKNDIKNIDDITDITKFNKKNIVWSSPRDVLDEMMNE